MPRRYGSLPPFDRDYDSNGNSDACSSTSESRSSTSSLRSFSSVSVAAVAGSPSPILAALGVGRRRVFDIASEPHIDDAAYRLADLIEGSSEESSAILHAIQLLWDSGIKSVEYARSIALIAEELYMQLAAYEEAVGDVFKNEMGLLAVEILLENWQVSNAPELNSSEAGNSACDARDTDLLRMSTFVGDLYAVGFITPSSLMDCLRAVVQKCTTADHLVYIFAMLSRANSYMGQRLPHNFYADFAPQLSEACTNISQSFEESFMLNLLIEELMDDSLDIQNMHNLRCAIPYTHVVNPRYHPVRMLVDESDHLGQMYDLLHTSRAPNSRGTCGFPKSSPSSLSKEIEVLERDIEQMLLSDEESSASSPEGTNCDVQEEPSNWNTFDCMSVLDIDFDEATPTFVKEGLHVSLNASVPLSLISPLPSRD